LGDSWIRWQEGKGCGRPPSHDTPRKSAYDLSLRGVRHVYVKLYTPTGLDLSKSHVLGMDNLETLSEHRKHYLIVELTSKRDTIDCFLGVDREGNHS
jgi:hypothetical protein